MHKQLRTAKNCLVLLGTIWIRSFRCDWALRDPMGRVGHSDD